MLAANGPAGVAPEVNLKNPFRAVEEACIEGSTLALKPWANVTRSRKERAVVTLQKCPPRFHE